MEIKKKKIVYILMGFAAVLLLLYRHIYIANPALKETGVEFEIMLLAELFPLFMGVAIWITLTTSTDAFVNKDYSRLMILGSIVYVLLYIVAIVPLSLDFLSVNISDTVRPMVPFAGILPVAMIYHMQEDKNSKKGFILTAGAMAFFAFASILLRQSLTGIYAMLLVMAVIFAIDGVRSGKYNWCLTIVIVSLAIVCTLAAFLLSKCSTVEHFVIAQYEGMETYIEGNWESAAIFDGRLRDAIGNAGLFSGTTSDLKVLFAGSYDAPVNMLLSYGWFLFILQMLSNIVIVAGCYVLVINIKDAILKNIGILIAVWIIVRTAIAYFLFPGMSEPLGLYTKMFDYDLLWVICLIAMAVRDHSDQIKLMKQEE